MPTGSIKKNYFYNVSFQIFSLLIPFVTAPYIARVLQASGVGTYSYANSIATYFSLVAALGISSYGLREVARVRDDKQAYSKLFWELSIIRIITTLVCLVLYAGFIVVSHSDWKIYLAVGVVILSVGVDCSWFLQAMENFKSLVMRNFVVKIISVVCIFLFVKTKDDLILYILIQTVGTFLSNIILYSQVRKYLVKFPKENLSFAYHFRETLVYFVPTIATSVYTVLDKTMIGAITKNMVENGDYEQAHRIVNMLLTVITSLNVVMGVRTSYLFGQDKDAEIKAHIRDTFRFMCLIAFPFVFGLLACAKTFVPWFYGDGYDKVIPLLMMFSPLIFIIGVSNVLGTLYLTPSGQRARSNKAVIAGAVCNFCMNMLLIPFLASFGAVIASVMAEMVISVLYLYFSRDFITVPTIAQVGGRYLIFSLIMFVPIYLLSFVVPDSIVGTLIQVAVGAVIYGACLILTKDVFWIGLRDSLRKRFRH